MSEPQYKPITGMINVNDIQEIIDNNRYYQEEIERLNDIIEDLHKKLCDIQDFIEDEIKQLDDDKFLLRVLDLEELLNIVKRS